MTRMLATRRAIFLFIKSLYKLDSQPNIEPNMVASDDEHPEDLRTVRRNPRRAARGNNQTEPARTTNPRDDVPEAIRVNELSSSRDGLASRLNADAEIAVSLSQDPSYTETKEDHRPWTEAHAEPTRYPPAPFVTDRAFNVRERAPHTTFHGREPYVMTLGDRLNLLRPYGITKFSGSKSERGRFGFFYDRLCKRVLGCCGSLAMMDEILLFYLSEELRQRVEIHLGSRPIPEGQTLGYLLRYLREAFDDQEEIEERLDKAFLSLRQGPTESVRNFELRWDTLLSKLASTRLSMSEAWLNRWICRSFRPDVAAKVSPKVGATREELWSAAFSYEKELKYSQSPIYGVIPPTGNVRSRKRVTDGRASHSSPRNRRATSSREKRPRESKDEPQATRKKKKPHKLSDDDRKRYMEEGRCFQCGEVGHRSRSCPRKKKADKSSDSYPVPSVSSHHSRSRIFHLNVSRSRTHSSLLRMILTVNGVRAQVLIDGGAEINAISEDFVRLNQIRTTDLSPVDTFDIVGAAPGVVAERCRKKCMDLNIVGPKNVTFDVDHLFVTRLNCDVILGKPWLAAHNPRINWRKNLLHFAFPTGTVTWKANSTGVSSMNGLCSAKQINSLLRRKRVAKKSFMLLIRTVPEEESSESGEIDFVAQYPEVFPDELPKELPPHRHIEHDIELKEDSKPKFQYPYRMSPSQRAEVSRVVSELLELGYIRPSMSPWGAPVLFAPKPDGTLRFCVDYRQLNKMTVRDMFPIPRTDELIDRLTGMKVFSKIDLWSAYYQMRLTEDAIPKSAFSTHLGHFEWLVLPFGMVNAPASFQSLMQSLLGQLPFVVVYLDDILVFSRTPEEHKNHVKQVLEILKENTLRAKKKKCAFFQSSIEYLGFIIDQDGLHPNPAKIQCVQDWPVPQNVKDVQSFLGLANYYRRFVKDFAKIGTPLTQLTRKDVPFVWSDACDEAFRSLKRALVTAPVLRLPDPTKDFFIEADASKFAIGAVLYQKDGRNCHPVAYISRKLSSAERNYPIQEQELLALIYALKKWRHYLFGTSIRAYTDHQSLVLWHTFKNLTGRKARWVLDLSSFNVELIYKKGLENIVADTLSRRPDHVSINNLAVSEVKTNLMSQIRDKYDSDPFFKEIVSHLKSNSDAVPKRLRTVIKWYRYENDLLWYVRYPTEEPRICLPRDTALLKLVFHECHESMMSGHLGVTKTFHRIASRFYFPKMQFWVRKMTRECLSCQSAKHSLQPPRLPLNPLDVPLAPWESVSMDFMVELPRTPNGFDALLVVVDRLTKFCILIPTTITATARDIAFAFLNNVVCRFGLPKSIVSDRDTKFTSDFWTELMSFLDTELMLSSAYHPETDGQTERMNQTLQVMIRHYITPDLFTWDLYLERLELAYNTSKHASAKHSPFYLNHGREAASTIDLIVSNENRPKNSQAKDFVSTLQLHWKLARDALSVAQEAQSYIANGKVQTPEYKVGDLVWLSVKHLNTHLRARTHHKFQRPYKGPYKITEKVHDTSFRLALPPTMKIHNVFYGGLLKKYTGTDKAIGSAKSVARDEPDQLYIVEAILRSKKRKGERHFLVKWQGFSEDHNTWEPESSLSKYVPDFIADFVERSEDERLKRKKRKRRKAARNHN